MTPVCKVLVYASDKNFVERLKKIFNGGGYILRVEALFIDLVNALQRELFDVLIIDFELGREIEGLLRVIDDILLGMPVIVASDGLGLEIKNGVNSRFYFLNKLAGEDEWKDVLQKVISENYLIKGG